MTLISTTAFACGDSTPPALQTIVEGSLVGDRTRACVAVAVIGETTERAVVCADPADDRGLAPTTAFEIGSISKTMTGATLADLLTRGKIALEDPLANSLPAGTVVPAFEGQPIRIQHLATQSSGLPKMPSRFPASDPDNPYASLTEADLLGSLADVQLAEAPGTTWAYSNFGFMLLSDVIARRSGMDFEAVLQHQLFQPLGMSSSFVTHAPAGTTIAVGHQPGGTATSAWDFPTDLAGVGGVRASLDDMISYAEAVLGRGDATAVANVQRAITPLATPAGGPPMGMGWVVLPWENGRLVLHDGGTGGFSSLIAIGPERDRAVVVLADTAMASTGFVSFLGLGLLDPALAPLPTPRRVTSPPGELVQQLVGRYRIAELELEVELVNRGGTLFVVVPGLPDQQLGYDDHGDFYPVGVDALLTPKAQANGGYTLTYSADGVAYEVSRLP